MAYLPKKTVYPATPRFYNVVRRLGETKFRVPKTFVAKYGEDLSRPVHLKVPGSKWKIELRKTSRDVWFAKGWAEFSEFYRLDTTNCLIFTYEGGSTFEVCILDETGTEIEYPVSSPEMETDEEDDKSVELLEEIVPSPLPPKKNRANTSASSSRPANLEAADKFVSKLPFFKATVGSMARQLYVPAAFRRQHLPRQLKQIVTFQVGDRSWPVNFIDNHDINYALCGGWAAFARENAVKAGDCCICELIDQKKVVLRVNIFRC